MPVLLNNICLGKHHPGYGISSGKLWKLRAAVNYALVAGKLVQVQLFVFALEGLCEGAATLLGQVNRNSNIIDSGLIVESFPVLGPRRTSSFTLSNTSR